MRKKWKRSKVILPLLLSAIMVVEPAAAATTVYAEESESTIIVTDVEETEDTDSVETPVDGTEENDQNVDNTGETDSDQSDGQEDEGVSDDNVGGGTESSPEDVDNQGDSSENVSDAEEGEASDAEADGEEELPDEELSDEELIDEEELVEESEEDSEAADAENEALNGFTGMPSTYKLTSQEIERKQSLSESIGEFNSFQEGSDYVEGEIVTFAESQEEAELIAKAYNAEIERFEYGILTLKLSDNVSVSTAIQVAADTNLNMPAVWPNYYRYLLEEEPADDIEVTDNGIEIETSEYELDELAALGDEFSDTSYTAALAAYNDPFLKSSSANYQWHHTVIGSPYVWAEGYTGSGVKVAVLDSGVASHTELSVTTLSSSNTSITEGHGTHVAGIIGAKANNGAGGAGVAPGVALYSYNLGEMTSSDIMAGIRAAIGEKVDLINMSIGGLGKLSNEQTVVNEAYQAGIAIFAAAGNEGGQTYSYPACYNHVISVAATDKNNERASFSSYNNMVDLSAPGAAIWSTYNTSNTSYVSMDGTSMACPVAVGEAAVILGSYDSIKTMAKNNKRVDALEKLMKANTVKAGSGMGAGITSLTKVFGLSTAATKPNAPEIVLDENSTLQRVIVTITAQSGMTVYYTTNGKNPSFKNGEADAQNGTTLYNGSQIVITDSTKVTVKAIAVNASGVSSNVKSKKYTLKPYVAGIEISGPTRVEQGKAIQLAATVTPDYAANKKVTWSIKTAAGAEVDTAKIKINNGKITAAAGADLGEYQVIATAQDDGGYRSNPYKIQVVAAGASIQSMSFAADTSKELWIGTSSSVDLAAKLTAKEKNTAGEVVDITTGLSGRVIWTSSKTAVAKVDDNGKVTAVSVGTTTITAKASDSGGKKASINITVKQPVTSIKITNDQGQEKNPLSVAVGKNLTLKAVIMPAKPTNKKVKWELENADAANTEGVSINASTGKITVKPNATPNSNGYVVKATAEDGQGASATQNIKVYTGAIGAIKWDDTSSSKVTLYTEYVDAEKTNTKTITATITGANGSEDFDPNAYTVTSSNESIVTASAPINGKTISVTLKAKGGMYGKANVVIASTDGSNKKATCAVTVSGGITKAEWLDKDGKKLSKQTLFRKGTAATNAPGTITIYAKLTGSAGANLAARNVYSNNKKVVDITNIGSATVDGNTSTIPITLTTGNVAGKATITLEATDGSKKKATCAITVANPASGVRVAPKAGNGGYVVLGKSLQLKATVESEYGALSNKNVTWELYKEDGKTKVDSNSSIKIASNGKVTAAKDKTLLAADGSPVKYKVKATAKDGSGVESELYTISLGAPTSLIYIYYGNFPSDFEKLNSMRVGVKVNEPGFGYTFGVIGDIWQGGFTVSSSNPSVVSVSYEPDEVPGKPGSYYVDSGELRVTAYKKGSATVTVKAMDGSGKQAKVTFIVQ